MKIAHISDIPVAEAHFIPELAANVIDRINKLKPEILIVRMIIANAGTACTNRVKWNIPQSFNFVEVDEEKRSIKIYRMYSGGGEELVCDKRK